MRHLTLGLVGALALALLSAQIPSTTPARAQATIDDCEKIQAADAYNQCLAKFGPTSKVKSVEPVKPGDIKDNSAEAAAGAGTKTRAVAIRGRPGRGHGRVVARAHRHGGKAAKVASKGAGRRGAKGTSKSAAKSGAKHGGRQRMTFTVRRHK